MFFSDNRLQQLTKQLRNDKVKDLLQKISSVIRSRVGQSDKVSTSTIKRVATTGDTASRDPKASTYWIKCGLFLRTNSQLLIEYSIL